MTVHFNKSDWIMLIIASITLFVIILPWQIYFYDKIVFQIHKIICISGWLIPLIYALKKVKKLKYLWAFRFVAILGIIYGSFGTLNTILVNPPMQNIYSELYSNPNNEKEKIDIIHNHGFLKNWNEIKHYISYPQFGFRIERKFRQRNLRGTWIVHEKNPFCEESGIVTFRSGEVLK